MKTRASAYRLEYLDWVRGIAALIMLQGHVFDSFLKADLRPGGAYLFSQFVGGMPPAIFLFLTGVTLAFLMDSTERKGIGPLFRVIEAFRRSGYLFFLAFAFRLQAFTFGFPAATWQDLCKVDVLNCMGFCIALLSVMAVFTTRERIRFCAILGLAIAAASPLISQMDWSRLPWFVRAYLVPDYRYFGLFPWGAYLAFGMSAGSVIRVVPAEATERMMQWSALLGGALILVCQYFASAPFQIYAKSEFWLNHPAQILTKVGVTLLILPVAFVWTRYGAKEGGWSFVRQFGITSLLVYWVHIELVYGRWFFFLKERLTVAQTILAAVIVILLMLALSLIKTNWGKVKAALSDMGWRLGPKADPVAGD
ncbi:conserved membrane hypothetical protein [Candidatus Sulfopaludibacter sp. SbA3]|nr:conserved membrane hypothetical protein [Candidatus Sulfopaludibacter sp. SbA3]